jgi:hypothetical protein
MKKVKLFLLSACFLFGLANAETTSQTLCFISQKNKNVELVLQTYLDNSLNQQVGAFVKYSTSKEIIPLVYIADNSNDDSIDLELHWLEVFEGRITGQYSLLKPKRATILGAYIRYKNLKSKKEVIFSPSGKSDAECAALLGKSQK